jgi:regulator of replication initiation timing
MGILETAKDVITLVQKADNLELVKQVLALQSDIMKMMDENRALKDEARTLKDQLHIKEKLVFRDNRYWLPKDDGTEDGPFCSTCHDTQRQLVRLHELGIGGHMCPACNLKKTSAKK